MILAFMYKVGHFMRLLIGVVLWMGMSLTGFSQESRLAEQYYQNGEFEKAAQVYLRLFNDQPAVDQYFERYIECLQYLKSYEEAENALRREIRKTTKAVHLQVMLGDLLKGQERAEEAEKAYAQALRDLPADRMQVIKVANAFLRNMNYQAAAEAYQKGGKLLKDPQLFSYNLGDLYRQSGDYTRMIEQYLITLRADPRRQSTIQMLVQRFLPEEHYPELQAQIFDQISQFPGDDVALIEMLTWTFLQQKDYRNALRQTRALDQKLGENGSRVFSLGTTAAQERDFEAAIEAFRYIIEVKGPESPFYYESRRQSLYNQRQRLVHTSDYAMPALRALEAEYRAFISEASRSRMVAPAMTELAELQAMYIHELDSAIALLEEVAEMPGLEKEVQSRAKLQLGDYYLIRGDIWDATLLYSQVDKLYKDDPLGHEARFRNARLSYFHGDFEWAQAQFKVLKASTSKLIANDALDLSVFITDNLGLDTSFDAMSLYAEAELLVFQNRHGEALERLEALMTGFPEHSLLDDVLYLKARIYLKTREFARAATLFQRVADEFPEDIRADNALFMLGELYGGPLDDRDKAMACYEKIFTDYSDSTFAVEARKHFRRLRGDRVQ